MEERPTNKCAKWPDCQEDRIPYSHLCRPHHKQYRRDRYRAQMADLGKDVYGKDERAADAALESQAPPTPWWDSDNALGAINQKKDAQ